jgi:hypothetical protein
MKVSDIDRPMHEAPIDGTLIWVKGSLNGEVFVTKAWHVGHGWREIGTEGQALSGVTHWAPAS